MKDDPGAQGLYDPRYEHDACGVGFVVDLKGRKSHDIVAEGDPDPAQPASTAAPAAARRTPATAPASCCRCRTRFLREECDAARASRCRPPGEYGVGMVFLPTDAGDRARLRASCSSRSSARRGRTSSAGATCRPTTRMLGPTAQSRRAGHAAGLHRPRPSAASPTTTWPSSASSTSSAGCVENAVRGSDIAGAGDASTSRACRAGRSSTRACSTPSSCDAVLPRPARPDAWSRPWRWSTRASAPTPSPPGSARTRTATSPTTARSTRCAATSTGCTPARACSRSELFGDDIEEDPAGHRRRRQRLGDVRQRARAARARPAARCRTR